MEKTKPPKKYDEVEIWKSIWDEDDEDKNDEEKKQMN